MRIFRIIEAKYGDDVKKLYLKQGYEEGIIDSYVNVFNEFRNKKVKELYADIPNVNIPKERRNDISLYRDFKELENVVDYIRGQLAPKREMTGNDVTPIYQNEGISIYRGDSPQECMAIRGGESATWCIAANGANNMYNTYRYKDNEPTFYFVKDNEGNDSKYRFFVMQVDKGGRYIVTSYNNDGDKVMSWGDILKIQPKLEGLQSTFKNIPLSSDEKRMFEKFKNRITDDKFLKFPYEEKRMFLDMVGHKGSVNDTKFGYLPDDLKNHYIGFGLGLSDKQFDEIFDKKQLVDRFKEITNRKLDEFNKTLNDRIYFRDSETEILNVDNNGKWIEAITKFIKENGKSPQFASDWCEKKLNSNDFPDEWLEEITKNIHKYGYPPEFSSRWCEVKLLSGEFPEEWIDSILAYVENNDESPVFADEWIKNELKSGNIREEYMRAIESRIKESGEFPDFARDWARIQLESEDTTYKPLSDLIETIIVYGRRFPDDAYEWILKRLDNGKASEMVIESINKYIEDQGVPPSYAKDWCRDKLLSGEYPNRWENVISKYVLKFGYAPYWAREWCKNRLDSGNYPKAWENPILAYVLKTGYPPEFAKDWYAKTRAIQKEVVEASVNWFKRAKG